jgi:hypothetical protein
MANPVTTPSVHALGVTPAVTFTLGGLPMNEDAWALDQSGNPLPGHHAVEADAASIHCPSGIGLGETLPRG